MYALALDYVSRGFKDLLASLLAIDYTDRCILLAMLLHNTNKTLLSADHSPYTCKFELNLSQVPGVQILVIPFFGALMHFYAFTASTRLFAVHLPLSSQVDWVH